MQAEPLGRIPGLAVVGAGNWGKNLVRNFAKIGTLGLICEKNPGRVKELKACFPDVDFCMALSDVLQRDDIHALAIATPAETHFAIAREGLLSGKHVFVEKPLVLNEDEGLELIRLAQENRRILMVGHLLRYHPAFVALKQMAESGELGRINYIYSHRLNLGRIRREENILWSFAPHDISMILSLAGEEPESLLTTGGSYLHRRIADVTTTHLEFPSGLKAHIFVSWLHPFKEQKLVVVGDRKMAVFDDTRDWPDKLLLFPHHIQWQNHMPIPAAGEPERVAVIPAEPLESECRHFLECIVKGFPPMTDGNEGLKVLRILNASQRSLDQAGAAIALGAVRVKQSAAAPRHCPAGADGNSAFIHETAVTDPDVSIGARTRIWHFSHVLSGSVIGEGCTIGQNAMIGPDVTVGRNCKIQNNVSVYKGVTLEDGVFCGPSVVFTNINNPRAELSKMHQLKTTVVKSGATIGANATIVCGVTLGRYCFVGAGAVVTRDVPDHALVVGNPAVQVGWSCRCGERLSAELACAVCRRHYHQGAHGLSGAQGD